MTASRSVILTYHSLDDSGSVISMPPERFRRQMEFLASGPIPVAPLHEALSRPNCVAITFDDGYRNLLEHAVPLLDRLRLPATIFVVSGHCGGRNNWPGQSAAAASLPIMNWRELASLPPWLSVGAHTVTHPDLTALPEAECERELRDCQDQIQQQLGKPARWLAYPYGSCSKSVMAAAGRRFDLAVGTELRFVSPQSCALDLPRIDAYYLRGRFSLERLFGPSGGLYIDVRRALRKVRQLAIVG